MPGPRPLLDHGLEFTRPFSHAAAILQFRTGMDAVTNKLHITIGTVPMLEPEKDLGAVKAALLYADKVKLYSLSSHSRLASLAMRELPQDALLSLMTALAPAVMAEQLDIAPDESKLVGELARMTSNLPDKSSLTTDQEAEIARLTEDFRTGLISYSEALELERIGSRSQLEAAIRADVLDVQYFDELNFQATRDFVQSLSSTVASGSTYPLFDDPSGMLLRAGIESGRVELAGQPKKRGHCILAADLLSRLPLFQEATVSEILDIRSALERPLTKFRAKMLELSGTLEHSAWDEAFPQEADILFHEQIAPAVQEIEQAAEDNRLTYVGAKNFIKRPLYSGTTVFGAAVGMIPDLANRVAVTGGIAAAAGAVAWAYTAFDEWLSKQREIEGNHLFFYYKAGKLMEENARQQRK